MVSTPISTRSAQTPTSEDHQVWALLYQRQTMLLPGKAEAEFLQGLGRVGFQPDRMPEFDAVSARLHKLTGWRLTPVDGLVDDKVFFELLAQRIFPAAWWIRPMDQLDYLPEPDMFHDVFGHVPLLANQHMADFLEGLAHVVQPHLDQPYLVELIARLYWYCVEFGLIMTDSGLRIYGAGILSSVAESSYSLGNIPTRHAFDIQHILATPMHKDRMQSEYFVIQDYRELPASLSVLEKVLRNVAAVLDDQDEASEAELAQAVLA